MNLKEKLTDALGLLGTVLSFALCALLWAFPLWMIHPSSFWIVLLMIVIGQIFPIVTTVVYWIWGLVVAIQGPQDVFAIIYYIAFGIGCLYIILSTIFNRE